jgi:hypothetical protein
LTEAKRRCADRFQAPLLPDHWRSALWKMSPRVFALDGHAA